MIAIPLVEKKYTLQEYLQFEEESEVRHEFHEGILYPVAATSRAHNEIVQNLSGEIRSKIRGKGCKVYAENVKLQLVENGKYVYPDLILTCDERDLNTQYSEFIIRYASLVIEVLSKSTEDYDRNGKFKLYQQIPSIQYYLLVDSRTQIADLYSRNDNSNTWLYQTFTERTDIIDFPKLNFQISLDDIYQDLTLPQKLSFIKGGGFVNQNSGKIVHEDWGLERLTEIYRAKGYTEDWIIQRLHTLNIRRELTDEWQKRHVKEGTEYAELTRIISRQTLGVTPNEHSEIKGINTSENLRDHMTKLELLFTSLGEEMTRQMAIQDDAQGFEANKEAAIRGGEFAGKIREGLERKEKVQIVSSTNFLSNNNTLENKED
jgi:Uma2 family endonuclease